MSGEISKIGWKRSLVEMEKDSADFVKVTE